MKKILTLLVCTCLSAQSMAVLPEMMQFFHHPASAPPVPACQGNVSCDAFTALAKQWHAIPSSYRYHGFDIRQQAKMGDAYGLNKGYSLQTERARELADNDASHSAYSVYYAGGSKSPAYEKIYARGLAVLLYIEDENGWYQP